MSAAERATGVMLIHGELYEAIGPDAELGRTSVPVTIIPSDSPNRYHKTTFHRLLFLIAGATSNRGFPESPRSDFGNIVVSLG